MSESSPRRNHILRLLLAAFGWVLLLATPFVGIIPGPGGIVVFAAGLALVLKNSFWAKTLYARVERRWPRFGRWANMALRRMSLRHQRDADALKREMAARRHAWREHWRARWRRLTGRGG